MIESLTSIEFSSAIIGAIVGALVGGFFTCLATCYTMWKQRKLDDEQRRIDRMPILHIDIWCKTKSFGKKRGFFSEMGKNERREAIKSRVPGGYCGKKYQIDIRYIKNGWGKTVKWIHNRWACFWDSLMGKCRRSL